MSDLNELFKVLSEGKKDYSEKNPVAKKVKETKEHVKEDLASLFSQLASLKEELVTIHDNIITEEPIIEEVLVEVAPVEPVIKTPEERIADTNSDVSKYLTGKSFQQPNPPAVDKNVEAIQSKIKFLEQAIGKIVASGPGSGEVNFRYLDDVNRITMTPSNDNWVLEYDAITKKVQFTENVGPIRTVKFNVEGYQTPLVAGQMGWNPDEDCLDIKQSDDTTLQVGLEQYIRVHNHTAELLLNGTVVKFAGVENTNSVAMPVVEKYIADGTVPPLYLIGVLTNDIPPGTTGRATTFGYVRTLNTTGSSVGETWVQGDLLWGHPTIAGAMTKVRPTAPNVSTSVGAVVRVGTTDGQILVRPTIWPRLFYGDWYSTETQTHTLINTPKRITLNQVGSTSGFTNSNGLITAQNAGLYNFQFSLQLLSSNSSAQYLWIWYRKNGVDAPNSATKLSISSNSIVLAPSWNFPVSMLIGDTFELMWAADSINMSLSASPASSFHPAVPSVILTVAQVNL